MKLIIDDGADEFECTKAIKGDDYLHVYYENVPIISFDGVSDFSGFVLEGGEFSKPEATEIEKLQAQLDYLMMMTEVDYDE